MQVIARTTMSIANTGPVTAAFPGSSQTARRPAMPVVTLAMVSLSKQVYLKSVLLNEVEKLL